uniref:Uncharacterized protein n=1 Tax=Arundo donax TaxID=35708 RepID=A0A0A9HV53_ARUDO
MLLICFICTILINFKKMFKRIRVSDFLEKRRIHVSVSVRYRYAYPYPCNLVVYYYYAKSIM